MTNIPWYNTMKQSPGKTPWRSPEQYPGTAPRHNAPTPRCNPLARSCDTVPWHTHPTQFHTRYTLVQYPGPPWYSTVVQYLGSLPWYNVQYPVHPPGTILWYIPMAQYLGYNSMVRYTGEYADTIPWYSTLAQQYPGHLAPWYNTLVQYSGHLAPGSSPWSTLLILYSTWYCTRVPGTIPGHNSPIQYLPPLQYSTASTLSELYWHMVGTTSTSERTKCATCVRTSTNKQ